MESNEVCCAEVISGERRCVLEEFVLVKAQKWYKIIINFKNIVLNIKGSGFSQEQKEECYGMIIVNSPARIRWYRETVLSFQFAKLKIG